MVHDTRGRQRAYGVCVKVSLRGVLVHALTASTVISDAEVVLISDEVMDIWYCALLMRLATTYLSQKWGLRDGRVRVS